MPTEAIYDATVTGKCQEMIPKGGGALWGNKPCPYNAGYRDADMVYCKPHHPATVAAKKEKWQQDFEARTQERTNYYERERRIVQACEGVPTEQLTPGILKRLLEAKPLPQTPE